MTARPLSAYPVERAEDPSRLRDAVGDLIGYDHLVVTREPVAAARRHGVVNGGRFDELSLVYVAYATPVRVIAPAAAGHVVLVVPLGPMTVEVAGHRETRTTPFVLSAASDTTMLPDPDAGALVGAVDLGTLVALLRDLFGTEREMTLDLSHRRPLDLNAARALHRTWHSFATVQGGDPADLVDTLLTGLSSFVRFRDGGAVDWATPPPYLTPALRHLHRHLADPLTLADLGDTVGIGTRQLQLAFRAHLGCTAQQYLRDARLDRSWHLLQRHTAHSAAAGTLTVSAVAAEVGIPHTGRFAAYFAQRFRVLPSALLH
ncbi:AraC family transcriptional regulator [Microbacterium sp. p3-SID336]|uniref:AraC family transcriptional regulator n=1 Tax=Microbacterium sp. p3-SID336 TaxID=2916212 RepID=UPI0021A7FDE3|nr:AraC family transcriptional regulator [Microbacterium sp. p3-SID336]MCT1476840.1 AraC family transcriptional regulator [Microbacterium sp. p3-SID336]